MTERARWYSLEATGRRAEERRRLEALQELSDPTSRGRLDLVQIGWHCLEVGAGLGSMAAWLGDRVGPTGHVVATDRDTTFLEHLPDANTTVVRHDILHDPVETLGRDRFDLIHLRAVLVHMPGREQHVVGRLVECLAPGGWLVVEETDLDTFASADPWHPEAAGFDVLFEKMRRTLAGQGAVALAAGRQLPALFARCGLARVRHEGVAKVVPGGSPPAVWVASTVEAHRGASRRNGAQFLSEEDIDSLTSVLADPTFSMMSSVGHATWGQKR